MIIQEIDIRNYAKICKDREIRKKEAQCVSSVFIFWYIMIYLISYLEPLPVSSAAVAGADCGVAAAGFA